MPEREGLYSKGEEKLWPSMQPIEHWALELTER